MCRNQLDLFNPFHDRIGRFANKAGGVGPAAQGDLGRRASTVHDNLRKGDSSYGKMPKSVVYGSDEEFYKATGLDRKKNWIDFAAVGADGTVHIHPRSMDLKKDYLNHIITHEMVHGRPRLRKVAGHNVTAPRITTRDQSQYWVEEGLTEWMSKKASNSPYEHYNQEREVVLGVARGVSNSDYGTWYAMDRMHKYNSGYLPKYIKRDLAGDMQKETGYRPSQQNIDAAYRIMTNKQGFDKVYRDFKRTGFEAQLSDTMVKKGEKLPSLTIGKGKRSKEQEAFEESEKRIWKRLGTIFVR